MDQMNNQVELTPLFNFTPPTSLLVQSAGERLPVAPLWEFRPPPSCRTLELRQSDQVPSQKRISEAPNITNDGPDRSFGSPIITLFAGAGRSPFYVHTEIISHRSAWFSQKYGDPEAGEQKLFLDFTEYDVDVVNTFVSYMYMTGPPLYPNTDDITNLESTISSLAKLYLLGMRFGVPRLQVKANQEVFERLDSENDESIQALDEDKFRKDLHMRIATIREVYTKTSNVNDPLRKTLVTNMARHWECYSGKGGLADNRDGTESNLSRFVEECPRFTKDLLKYLKNSTPGSFVQPRAVLGKKRKVRG